MKSSPKQGRLDHCSKKSKAMAGELTSASQTMSELLRQNLECPRPLLSIVEFLLTIRSFCIGSCFGTGTSKKKVRPPVGVGGRPTNYLIIVLVSLVFCHSPATSSLRQLQPTCID